MTRMIACVVIALGLVVAGERETRGAKAKPRAPTNCDKIYARPFTVTRAAGKTQMRLLRLPPPRHPAGKPLPPTDRAVFDVSFQLCKGLGDGWHVAPGSFGAAFLKELEASDSPELKAALAVCPVTFRRIDTVCAPCVAGSKHCPCADRDISDWIFCEKQ